MCGNNFLYQISPGWAPGSRTLPSSSVILATNHAPGSPVPSARAGAHPVRRLAVLGTIGPSNLTSLGHCCPVLLGRDRACRTLGPIGWLPIPRGVALPTLRSVPSLVLLDHWPVDCQQVLLGDLGAVGL
eukprot:736546-Heterocapsa_arctica.AAC.1